MKNKLTFRVEYEDGEIELFLRLNVSGFSGEGRAFFSRKSLNKFIDEVCRYPLDEKNPPILSGGYWSQGGGEILQENVHFSLIPKGGRGQIDMVVRLAVPSDEDQMKSKYGCFAVIETTYAEVSIFSEKFQALVNRELAEDYFDYPICAI